MIECGTVLERREDGRVVVEVDRTSACDGCHAKGACNMGFGSRKAQVTAQDPVGRASVGQTVTLEIGDADFLAACAWVYLVPLAGLLLGALLAFVLLGWAGMGAARDLGGALGALAGLAAGVAVVWRYDRRVRSAAEGPGGRFQVRVREVSGD